jgi:hypothetical protein
MFTYPQDECFFEIAKTFLTSIIASSHLPRSHSAAARVRIKGGYSTIFGDSDAFKASSGLPTALKHEHKIAIAPKLPGAKCRIFLARLSVRVTDRPSCEHRLFNSIRRGNVWFGKPRTHGNTNAGLHEVRAATRSEFAVLD